jgi:hypothetical protein
MSSRKIPKTTRRKYTWVRLGWVGEFSTKDADVLSDTSSWLLPWTRSTSLTRQRPHTLLRRGLNPATRKPGKVS